MKRNVVHYSRHYTATDLFECKSYIITQVELYCEPLLTTDRNILKFITQQPRASVSEWLLQLDKKVIWLQFMFLKVEIPKSI
jgi:hypothetical protein